MDERLAVNLDVMLEAARSSQRFIAGMSLSQFLADEKTQAAVVMRLITIGESAVRITQDYPEFTQTHRDWPWDLIRAMRNRSAHAYQSLRFEVVWDTVTVSVPALLRNIEALGPLDPPLSHNRS